MNPRVARTVLVAAGITALLSAFVSAPQRPVVTIGYVYSPDAKELLQPLIDEFNASDIDADGRTVHVSGTDSASGDALRQIQDDGLEPVAWTPASSLWGKLLDAKAGPTRALELGPSLVQSPQVVAMFKTSADRVGLSPSGSGASTSAPLQTILDLASSGNLKLGHTDPNVSTSGLSAVLSEFYLATGKRGESLRSEDVLGSARETVRSNEGSIVHYVNIATDFKDLWCKYGSPFADAAYMQETTFLEFNQECEKQLMALYPTDVPLVADYPYIVLDAPWVSSQQRDAGDVFGRWLEERLSRDCDHVTSEGFRKDECVPGDVDPTQPKKAPPPLPAPDVLAEVQQAWGELRRPANVVLVVDQSQPMARADRLPLLKQALLGGEGAQSAFVACPRGQDRVGMKVFGGQTEIPVDIAMDLYLSDARERLSEKINRLDAERGGAIALWDAIDVAVHAPGMQNPETINTIVVLSLGVDDGSVISHGALKQEVSNPDLPVQILAVAYGGDEETLQPLNDLVEASLGRTYDGDVTDDVEQVSEFICQFL